MSQSDTESGISSGWLSSRPVLRLQALGTKLRFALAVPVVAALFAIVDEGPLWPGVSVALAGEMLQLWATAHLRKNTRIVKSGPYAWLRNPMYMGRFFVGLGLALLTWRWFLVAPYVIVYWVYAQARVLGEERRLRELFAGEYQDYCRKVGRWLPRPPREKLSMERWSWDAVMRNHELRVAGGVLLVLALLKWRVETFGPFWGHH
ncbi:MAG: isoprenylcysteine carboxylmethyltransferase family protein [Armatimonadota bacterium]